MKEFFNERSKFEGPNLLHYSSDFNERGWRLRLICQEIRIHFPVSSNNSSISSSFKERNKLLNVRLKIKKHWHPSQTRKWTLFCVLYMWCGIIEGFSCPFWLVCGIPRFACFIVKWLNVLCEAVIRIFEHRRFSHSAPVPSSSSVNDMKREQVAAEMFGHKDTRRKKCWWWWGLERLDSGCNYTRVVFLLAIKSGFLSSWIECFI